MSVPPPGKGYPGERLFVSRCKIGFPVHKNYFCPCKNVSEKKLRVVNRISHVCACLSLGICQKDCTFVKPKLYTFFFEKFRMSGKSANLA